MFCEVEFIAVGEGSRPGDAIIVRYGDPSNYKLMLIDGGTAATGTELVAHLKHWFGANVTLEHVVLTHSDADHASGLREVLREIPVANLWLHIPWLLAQNAVHLFKDKRWTYAGLADAIKKEYDIISEIVDLGFAKSQVSYPFQGAQIGPFTVLSPTHDNYLGLLPQFEKTPEPDQALIEAAGLWIGKAPAGIFKALMEAVRATVSNLIPETWTGERLRDGGITSASNESSVVLYADVGDDRRILLTGDAGIRALTWSAEYARFLGLPLQSFAFVQIPHHGSRRNVGPTILNEILGPIRYAQGIGSRFTAFVSAPKDDASHPRKIVLNAFTRRGADVVATQGKDITWRGGFPLRPGHNAVPSVGFFDKVEAYED